MHISMAGETPSYLDEVAVSARDRVSFSRRLAATILDWFLVIFAGHMLSFMLNSPGTVAHTVFQDGAQYHVHITVGSAWLIDRIEGVYILAWLYYMAEAFTGATLGKWFLGIRIANPDGSSASMRRLVTRYLVKNAYIYCAFAAGITGIWMFHPLSRLAYMAWFLGCLLALGATRMAFHDRVAATAVYRIEDVR